jgi:geranylgeranyl diphosphate synthase type II
MNLKSYLSEKRTLVDEGLRVYFPEAKGLRADLIKAMEYSLFAGGKRLRPILCIAGAEAVGGSAADVLPIACSLELIHTYSLIHDDLPTMDNDDLRRGKPTNHKIFGEAIAILAGDGLLTEAFSLITRPEVTEKVSPQILLKVIHLIADAAGYDGMVGGQVVDIQSEGKKVNLATLDYMHTRKTGALITAAVTSGAMLGGGREGQTKDIFCYGQKIGLAFQISDDILDIEGDSETLGKRVGADQKKGKITYPAVVGLNRSKEIQSQLVDSAIESLGSFDHRADPLKQIARYIIERRK